MFTASDDSILAFILSSPAAYGSKLFFKYELLIFEASDS